VQNHATSRGLDRRRGPRVKLAPVKALSLAAAGLGVVLAACGGGAGASPGQPTASGPRIAVDGVVGYDEDASGTVDDGERVRFGGASVHVGDRSAVTDAAGRFAIGDAPSGRTVVAVDAPTLPPFFEAPGRPLAVTAHLDVGVTLPIGQNRPHVYMAFGDSISAGVGSARGDGYRGPLAQRLRERWGRAEVVNEGQSGTPSAQGAARVAASLAAVRPAYTLVHYGTNDWTHGCRQTFVCPTLDNLRAIVRDVKAASSLPVLATLLPIHPGQVGDPLAEARAAWIEETNGEIRQLAQAEGLPLADVHAAFLDDRDRGRLFADDIHPSDRGYDVIADRFFTAITERRR
jgi:lysophospholipase L1-like esterase